MTKMYLWILAFMMLLDVFKVNAFLHTPISVKKPIPTLPHLSSKREQRLYSNAESSEGSSQYADSVVDLFKDSLEEVAACCYNCYCYAMLYL